MKKLFLYLAAIFFISTIVISCEKEKVKTTLCETCDSQNFKLLNFKLQNQNFVVKAYSGEKFTHYTGLLENSNQITFLYKNNNESKLKDDPFNAIAIYFNNVIDGDTTVNLYNENILAYATYTIENGEAYRVKIFERKAGVFEEFNKSFKTTEITSNDINGISKILFKVKPNVLFLAKNILLNIDDKQSFNQLSIWLKCELANKGTADEDVCNAPCPPTKGKYLYCAFTPSPTGGVHYCKSSCSEGKIANNLISLGVKKFDYIPIANKLYDFRDNYLNTTDGGKKIIDEYYYLSDRFKIEKISFEQQIYIFDLLVSDVIPAINSIISDPNSKEILISDIEKEKLINLLEMVKQKSPDIDFEIRINHLIEMVNHFSNRSNNFITSILNDF